MRTRLLSFGAIFGVVCALLIVAGSATISARCVVLNTLGTSQCGFNPSGFLYVKGELPKGFEDFGHIALWTFDSEVSRPTAGVYNTEGAVHEFKSLTAKWSAERSYFLFEFATASAKGIAYTLTGKFLRDCEYGSIVKDPTEIVAQGQLAKLKDGKRVADAAVQFTYSPLLRDKNTELMQAASKGDLTLVKTLLGQGTNVGATVPLNGTTVLQLAVRSGNAALVKTLLAAGADPKAKDGTNRTTLMYAAGTTVEMVNVLVQAGVDVNAKESGGDTALTYAVSADKADIVEALIRAGAAVNGMGEYGEPVLIRAASQSPDLVKLLIAAKADVNARGYNDRTALINAALRDGAANVEALIRAGADANARDSTGWTPLMYVAGLGFLDSAKVLLTGGAEVNAKDKDGNTALMHAIQGEGNVLDQASLKTTGQRSPEMVKALIAGGADVQAADKDGRTALSMAASRNANGQNAQIVSVLKQAGAR